MKKTGFTLIEMLVVIAIIALLATLTVPATQKALSRARATMGASQLRQFHQAAVLYALNNQDRLPAVADESGWRDQVTDERGRFGAPATWPYALAEYLGMPDIRPGVNPPAVIKKSIFTCPNWTRSAAYARRSENSKWDRRILGGYGMNRNIGLDGNSPDSNWSGQYIRRHSMAQPNASSILMFAEGSGSNGDLGTRWDFNRFGQASYEYLVDPNRHNGGSNLCYLDGHVVFMREAMIVARGQTGALFYD